MISTTWSSALEGEAGDLVRIAGLCVDYGGHHALDNVSLRIPQGEVFGLLGPNGAGKTTIFRVLATLLAPTSGEVLLCGRRIQQHAQEIRSLISYMPDLAPMPSDLRVIEYLRFFAEAYGMRGRNRDIRVSECLETVALQHRSKDICTRLSLGMRQRLALAKAILHRPRLLILDEPASGLDPVARVDLKNALRRQADEGATVILSSHVMAEIQELCTSIGLLQRGRLIDAGPIRSVLERCGGDGVRVQVRAPGRMQEVIAWLSKRDGLSLAPLPMESDMIELRVDGTELTLTGLFTELGEARLGVTGFQVLETSVEDVVIGLAGNEPLK